MGLADLFGSLATGVNENAAASAAGTRLGRLDLTAAQKAILDAIVERQQARLLGTEADYGEQSLPARLGDVNAQAAERRRQAGRPFPVDPLSPEGVNAQVDIGTRLGQAGFTRTGARVRPAGTGTPVAQKVLPIVERQLADTRADLSSTRAAAKPVSRDQPQYALDPARFPADSATAADARTRLPRIRATADSLEGVRDSLAAVAQGRRFGNNPGGTGGRLAGGASAGDTGAAAPTGAKIPVSQDVYNTVVQMQGAPYAQRHFSVQQTATGPAPN